MGELKDSDLGAVDAAHHLHPFTDNRALREAGGPLVIDRGDGCWIWDENGKRYLDAFAGLWCVNVGYGRKELAEAARRQMERLAYYNTFFRTTTAPAARLARKLVELSPDGLDHVVFANAGSEANDTVIRLARQYWSLAGKPGKRVLIGREEGYHGATLAAASLGGVRSMHEHAGLPLPDFVHVEAPYRYENAPHLPEAVYGRRAAGRIRAKIVELGADKVAAVMVEPIQGAGGAIIPPPGYLAEVESICREHDVLFCVDEVVTAFGRLGAWTASELYGLSPDMMSLAKGLSSGYQPISAVMVGRRVAGMVLEAGDFSHGFTYGGHPVAAAVALENLAIIERERLVERVRDDLAPRFAAAFAPLASHPLVGEVRTAGLIAAVELVQDKQGPVRFDPRGVVGAVCRDHMQARGIIVRSVRDTIIAAPPLIVTHAQVDLVVNTLLTVLNQIQSEIGLIAEERDVRAALAGDGRPLAGRLALVTGASRGIGAAVARRLAAAGASVVLTSRDAVALEGVAEAIRSGGDQAQAVAADLTDGAAYGKLHQILTENKESLDILVLNAGMLGTLGPLAATEPEMWQGVMDTNLGANQRLIATLDPLLRASDAGRVICVTSGAARGDMAGWGAYAAAKAGLEAMMRAYAAETRHTAIRVNAVDPGEVRTAMRAQAFPDEDPARLREPDAVAEVFVQLAAPACSLTGAVVPA